jgi:hypothetical protein
MKKLTIAYITARQEPRIEWFMDSLARQSHDALANVLIIDSHPERPLKNVRVVQPKPCVWQGPHKLTAVDFFSASNARNTAICLCKTEWIAMVDDLSVLMPGWLDHALEATEHENTITCGAFRKVKGLEVEDGLVKKFTHYEEGLDWRLKLHRKTVSYRCPPEWFFGCSFVAPLEALLQVNGYPELLCDGMGYEDTIMGLMLGKNVFPTRVGMVRACSSGSILKWPPHPRGDSPPGIQFRFDPEMVTWESEDDHHNQPSMLRIDPGISPNDKSHAVRKMSALNQGSFHQTFGRGSSAEAQHIRSLRASILRGEPFPVPTGPTHEWFTGMPLSEFHNYKPQ